MRVVLTTDEFVVLHCVLAAHSLRVEAPRREGPRFAELRGRVLTEPVGRPVLYDDGALPIVPKKPNCRHCKRALLTACQLHGGPATDVRSRHYARLWRAQQKKGVSA